MSNLSKMFDSSVGRKFVMSLTGLFLCSFLIVHLVGNLGLYYNDGGETFNRYTHFMATNWFIRIMEIVLVLGFVIHILMAVRLTRQNAKARPVDYDVKSNKTSNVYSRNMGFTGTIILIFLILHLADFWFKYHYGIEPTLIYDGEQFKDMYTVVLLAFKQWWIVATYVIGMILLGAHLNHGFQSAFQSLGFNDKFYAVILKQIGTGFAILMTVGFISFPILFYFGVVGNPV